MLYWVVIRYYLHSCKYYHFHFVTQWHYYKILPSARETDLDLEENVFVAESTLAVLEVGVREFEPLGSCIVLSFGLAVKLRRLSERLLYFDTALATVLVGVVVAVLAEDCNPNPATLNEFSLTSWDCWGEL